MMARSSVGSLNDAREVLKEVDRRKSNLNYNLMLLERERTMSDTKTLLKIILTEGYDSERVRARRLIDQLIEASKFKIQDNVDKSFAEAAEKTRERNIPPTARPLASKSKLSKHHVTNSRLFEAKPKACIRCIKKSEASFRRPELNNSKVIGKGIYKTTSSKLPLPSVPVHSWSPNNKPGFDQTSSVPLQEKPLHVRSLRTLPNISTEYILTEKALKMRHNSTFERHRLIVPLGLQQENKVVKSSKETNTDQCSVSLQSVKHDDSQTKPRTFSIQVLPSINIESVKVIQQATSPCNNHHVEFQEKNDVVHQNVGRRSVQAPDDEITCHPEIAMNRSSFNRDEVRSKSSFFTSFEVDKLSHPKTDVLERKLVRYVMEKLASMENPDVHGTDKPVNVNDNYVVDELQNLESAEKSNTSLPLVNKPGVAYSEVGVQGIFPQLSRRHILDNVSSPSSDCERSTLNRDVIPTPVPTPTSSSLSSPPRVLATPSTSPDSEPLSSPVEFRQLEEGLRISTPNPSISTPSHQESVDRIKNSVIIPQQSKNEKEYGDQTSYHEVISADDHLSYSATPQRQQSKLSDDVSEVGLKMGTKIEILDNHSLGQAPTVGGDGIKRPVSLVLESSSTTSDEADTQSELEHDLLDITSSTTLSEGEVKAYRFQMGAGRRVLAAFGSRLNRRGRLSDWSMAVKQGALVLSRDKTSRPFITTPFDTEHSEMSIGEVLVLPPAYSSDAKEVTKGKLRTVVSNLPVQPSYSRQESLSEGEVLSKD